MMAATRRHAANLVLLAWVIILIPGGIVDVAVARPAERVETAAIIVALAVLVALVARFRASWLGPGTALLGAVMAVADPFEEGPVAWRIIALGADLILAVLGLRLWLITRHRGQRGPLL